MPGALQGRFPGILYKELSAEQCRESADWNKYAGLSFWVKGDGSDNSGCLAIGPAGEKSWAQGFGSSAAYVCYFPLKNTDWHRVTAAWHELVPEETQPVIGAPGGMAPGEIRVLRLGNRWFNHQPHPEEPRPGQHYAVARIQFEKKVPAVPTVPPLPPLADARGSLGLAVLGRCLYYASHTAWSAMAHLMSYDLDTGVITHYGPIIVEDGRRVCELQSLTAGADGKLHGVAMVWSLSAQDPAPAGAIRGRWNFHPRFVVIDPANDFHPAKESATPKKAP